MTAQCRALGRWLAAAALAQRPHGGHIKPQRHHHPHANAEDEHLAQQQLAPIADVAQGLARGEMRLHFQPIVDLRTGRTVRAEALVRWARPGGAAGAAGRMAAADRTHGRDRAAGRLGAALATMRACTALGAGFALDDFGTGYSSLAYLKTLPVAVVKIDRSFVAGLDVNEGDRRIVQGIVELVGGYGLQAVAEGVETAAQARELLAAGCTLAQGYGILPPVAEPQLLDWLNRPPASGAEAVDGATGGAAAGLAATGPGTHPALPSGIHR